MARRRMFSLDVVDTDLFLDMGATARLLYYDLGMRADDDGFIFPQKVMRMTGASGDDLKVLAAKGLVFQFDDGVMVMLHWLRNNKIDSDKYTPSIFQPRLKPLMRSGQYLGKLSAGRPVIGSGKEVKRVPKRPIEGPLKGPGKDPQYSIGKGSAGEDINPYAVAGAPVAERNETYLFWEDTIGAITVSQETQRKASVTLQKRYGADGAKKLIRIVAAAHSDRYARKEVKCMSLGSLLTHADQVMIYAKSRVSQEPTVLVAS